MQPRRPVNRETEILPEPVSVRLLNRASELDAALRGGATVAELRAAADEAGISPRAFDAALAELRDAEPDPATNVRRSSGWRGRMGAVGIGVVALMAVASLGVSRSAPVSVPTIEEAFRLRCLSAAEAGELIRPVIGSPKSTRILSPGSAPRVLTIRATPADMEKVRSVLDQYEGAGAPACPTPPAKAP